jgi:membrane protein DedA with SNARE-associated domain
MSILPHAEMQQFIANYGYLAVAGVVGLESMGLPLPGETILVLAAIYAATNPDMSIGLVVAAAAAGAIIGDNVGYWIGQRYGYPLLLKYGSKIGVGAPRIKVGQYLFKHYGGKVVFFGRFVALLRILAAFLAGVNKMPWGRFMVANAFGGVVWACVFGFGGYVFGQYVFQLHGTLAPILLVGAAIAFFGFGYLMHRYENSLIAVAEKEIPDIEMLKNLTTKAS